MAQSASISRPAEGTLIARWDEDPHGRLQMIGAEEPLAKEGQDRLDGVHRFAAEVLRPIGERLDRMTPEEVIEGSSPLWQAFTEFAKLGIGVDQLLAFEPAQAARAACLILEELGWGDAGLASSWGPHEERSLYVKAPMPVMARPTMSVCMVSVPSKVWIASRSAMCRAT